MTQIEGCKFGRFARLSTGSAAVELAIVLPLLILVVIGAADLGRMFFTGIAVANAARSAAEIGAQTVANSSNTALINQAGVDDGADAGTITITSERTCQCLDGTAITCTDSCPSPYTLPRMFVKARATKTLTMIINYPGLPQSITFRDSAVFRVQ